MPHTGHLWISNESISYTFKILQNVNTMRWIITVSKEMVLGHHPANIGHQPAHWSWPSAIGHQPMPAIWLGLNSPFILQPEVSLGNLDFPIKLSLSLIYLTLISSKFKKMECLELWLFKFSAVGKFFFFFSQFYKILSSGSNPLHFMILTEENYNFSWEQFLCLWFASLEQAGRGSSNISSSLTLCFQADLDLVCKMFTPLQPVSLRNLFLWSWPLESFSEKRGPSGTKHIGWCHLLLLQTSSNGHILIEDYKSHKKFFCDNLKRWDNDDDHEILLSTYNVPVAVLKAILFLIYTPGKPMDLVLLLSPVLQIKKLRP